MNDESPPSNLERGLVPFISGGMPKGQVSCLNWNYMVGQGACPSVLLINNHRD
jgi:hypothetical protein